MTTEQQEYIAYWTAQCLLRERAAKLWDKLTPEQQEEVAHTCNEVSRRSREQNRK